MKILILGADGYLGWPTAMHFSALGHSVIAVDNYFKRDLAMKLNCESLISCVNLNVRASLWQEVTGRAIDVRIGDVTDYGFLGAMVEDVQPDVIVHYAEQPSAPYSMLNRDAAAVTLKNNLVGTLNIVHAIKKHVPNCHLIKLGTMGEYGTPNIDIEEGWIDIVHKGRHEKFLFPRQASSLYHTTKIQDTDMLWFYVRTWGLRVTDLMQGPVYGILTGESNLDERLLPSFHYDEIFGTVVNRFIVQAICGHPLTVYGKGTQIRGYLNLKDTLACVNLSANDPADPGELRIFNQITETFSVNQLADMVSTVGKQLGYSVTVGKLENPRVEKEDHYYNPTYSGLLDLGLCPHRLTDEVLRNLFEVVARYRDQMNQDVIYRGIRWQ